MVVADLGLSGGKGRGEDGLAEARGGGGPWQAGGLAVPVGVREREGWRRAEVWAVGWAEERVA